MAALTLAKLDTFQPTLPWLNLAHKLISVATPDNNTAQFLTLYKALPPEFQEDYEKLLNSTEDNTYNQLRTALTQRFTLPLHSHFDSLYSPDPIGDRSPSDYLRAIRRKHRLANVDNEAQINYMFVQGLPQTFGSIVLSRNDADLDELALTLDTLWRLEKRSPKHSINSTTHHKSETQQDMVLLNMIKDLSSDILRLTARISELETANNTNRQVRPPGRQYPDQRPKQIGPRQAYPTTNSQTCPTPPNTYNRQGLCRFHCRFGAKAFS